MTPPTVFCKRAELVETIVRAGMHPRPPEVRAEGGIALPVRRTLQRVFYEKGLIGSLIFCISAGAGGGVKSALPFTGAFTVRRSW